MEVLKDLPFGIALLIIGAIFALLGLSGGFSVANYSLMIQETWARVVTSLVGGSLIGLGTYMELKSSSLLEKSDAKDVEEEKPSESAELQAEAFFYTLDHDRAQGFPDMVGGAIRLGILARTGVNLLNQYHNTFEQLSRSGCETRILFVDPSSEACKLLYSNLEMYRSNIAAAASHLKELRQVCGRQLEVRVIQYVPTVSIITVEKPDPQQSFVQVQLYFLHGALGWDRPIFRVSHGDKWYRVFQDEFSKLWSDSEKWDVS
jgi:hypothetical protein